MDQDPTNHLQTALKRDINGLLEYEGMVLPDREILIRGEQVWELDVVDIVVGRNDTYRRTVCHVQRPSTDEFYWRHDTYVAWDDGRTAYFQINLALDETEQRAMLEPQAARHALQAELNRLVYNGVLEAGAAESLQHMILANLANVKDEINEALLKQEELADDDSIRVIKTILETIDTHITLNKEPHSDLNQLYAVIRRLRRAQFEAMALREVMLSRYLEVSDHHMDEAEANPTSNAPAAAVWTLLELLDRIR